MPPAPRAALHPLSRPCPQNQDEIRARSAQTTRSSSSAPEEKYPVQNAGGTSPAQPTRPSLRPRHPVADACAIVAHAHPGSSLNATRRSPVARASAADAPPYAPMVRQALVGPCGSLAHVSYLHAWIPHRRDPSRKLIGWQRHQVSS